MKKFYSHLDFPGHGTVSALFRTKYGMKEVDLPGEADIIIWNGGEDIGTSIYNEQPVMRGIPLAKSKRDVGEIALFNEYRDDKSKFLLGVCRGAQLLNCLNGGKLYQHVNGHNSSHAMVDLRTKEVIEVTSTHHQQMIAGPVGQTIGVSSCSTHKDHESGPESFLPSRNLLNGADVEIVWYPDTRSLCIQGHPEYVPDSRFAQYTLELINQFSKELAKAA